jgi:hypothetical protein
MRSGALPIARGIVGVGEISFRPVIEHGDDSLPDECLHRALQMSRPVAREKHVFGIHEGGMRRPVDEHRQRTAIARVNACDRQIRIVNCAAMPAIAIAVRNGNGSRAGDNRVQLSAGFADRFGQLVGCVFE